MNGVRSPVLLEVADVLKPRTRWSRQGGLEPDYPLNRWASSRCHYSVAAFALSTSDCTCFGSSLN